MKIFENTTLILIVSFISIVGFTFLIGKFGDTKEVKNETNKTISLVNFVSSTTVFNLMYVISNISFGNSDGVLGDFMLSVSLISVITGIYLNGILFNSDNSVKDNKEVLVVNSSSDITTPLRMLTIFAVLLGYFCGIGCEVLQILVYVYFNVVMFCTHIISNAHFLNPSLIYFNYNIFTADTDKGNFIIATKSKILVDKMVIPYQETTNRYLRLNRK